MIIIRKNGKLIDLQPKPFNDEEELRKQLLENLNIIPFRDISEGADESIVAWRTEFPLSVGSIDVASVGNGGGIYLIETKLFKNQDKRKVVAQALDYASDLWKEYSQHPEEFLDKLQEGGYGNVPKEEKFQTNIRQNLRDANYNIIIAMDNVTQQVKDLIGFLNKHTDFNVLTLEVERYVGNGLEIVLPKIYGEEISRERPALTSEPPLSWEEFIKQCDEPGRKLYEKLKQLAEEREHLLSATRTAFSYYAYYKAVRFCLLTIYPKDVYIFKYSIHESGKIPPGATSKFREEMLKIRTLKDRYDDRKLPNMSTREGDLSDNEIEIFITAFRRLLDSIT